MRIHRIALFATLSAFSGAALADNHCPRPAGVPAGARYSCNTRTQSQQPGEPATRHPGGSPGRRDGAPSPTQSSEGDQPANGSPNSGNRTAARDVQSIRIWVNAFIPRTLESPNIYGRTYRNGPDGATFVLGPDPLRRAGYLTDQREFSSDPGAHSRFHAEARIELTPDGVPRLARQDSWCSATVAFDTISGKVLCKKSAGNDELRFEASTESETTLVLALRASAANPCVDVLGFDPSPHIKADLSVNVNTQSRRLQISGRVTQFPAFEAYASVNGGPAQAVFRKTPVSNKSPWDLYLGPTEPVSGTRAF